MSYMNESATDISNWMNAQIGIKVTTASGEEYTFANYIRLSVNRAANYNVYHSVGKHNQGYIKLPRGYTFSTTVAVTSKDVQILRALFNGETIFDFEYFDAHATNTSLEGVARANATEFKLVKEKLKNCILTGMNDSYEVEGTPMVVFNGTALDNKFVADVTSDTLTTHNFGDNSTKLNSSQVGDLVDSNYWTIGDTEVAGSDSGPIA